MLLGILILLYFVSVGLSILLFLGIKEVLRRQRHLADRLGVVEELIIELTSETFEPSEQEQEATGGSNETEARASDTSGLAISGDSFRRPNESELQQPMVIEDERRKEIYALNQQGVTPGEIARRTGCGVGEVHLVLSLHKRSVK